MGERDMSVSVRIKTMSNTMNTLSELEHLQKAVVDAEATKAAYEAANAAALVKYAAALDAALIDSLFAAYREQD